MTGLVPFNQRKMNFALRPHGFEDFYNLLDDFFNDSWTPQHSLLKDIFRLDVQEKPGGYEIEAELPGVKKEEISLKLNEGKLTITIKREEKLDDEKKNYVHKERRYSSMQRTVNLADANPEGIKAKLEDGVLSIQVPKLEKQEISREIVIE